MDGYLPLQNPPAADLLKAQKLLGYIKNVLSTAIDTQVGTGAVWKCSSLSFFLFHQINVLVCVFFYLITLTSPLCFVWFVCNSLANLN